VPPVTAGTRLRRGEDPVARGLQYLDRPAAPEALADVFDLRLDLLAGQRPRDESDARGGAGDSLPGRGEAGDADAAAGGDVKTSLSYCRERDLRLLDELIRRRS
jgi:hypothetical protein